MRACLTQVTYNVCTFQRRLAELAYLIGICLVLTVASGLTVLTSGSCAPISTVSCACVVVVRAYLTRDSCTSISTLHQLC